MWATIFFITTIVCGAGWLSRYISVLAIVYYIEKKGYIQPSDEEIRECTLEAAKHLFK